MDLSEREKKNRICGSSEGKEVREGIGTRGMKTECVLIDSWIWGVLYSDAVEIYCSRTFLESKRLILVQTPRNGA